MTTCKYGATCFNKDPEHRRRFVHPAEEPEGTPSNMRVACKYGFECFRKKADHLGRFAHPGDRNYRIGLVIFKDNQRPEFQSLWQLFQYHDPDESGHLSKEEFAVLVNTCRQAGLGAPPDTLDQAWQDAGGLSQDYVNFRQFVSWTQDFLRLELVLGLEDTVTCGSRPCRFRHSTSTDADGYRCSCPAYQESGTNGLCACGHKTSMHRSDFAQRTFTKFLEDTTHSHWKPGAHGLVEVEDGALVEKLQELLQATHKTTDNWTRDRGCKSHGVNGCAPACASRNRVAVPSGYQLVKAYRNQNMDLWQKYSLVKTAITEECGRGYEVDGKQAVHEPVSVATTGHSLEVESASGCNEWYLFHGSTPEKCKTICMTNFKLALAGSGATWKDPSTDKGTPLYGFGIYLAERITKADEYSAEVPGDDPVLPSGDLFTCILCRVVGGRAHVVTTNEIEIDKLRSDVFDGPYHSVLGDRVTSLGKPYREVVVYDKDQCYPEFLLVYARSYH